MVDTYYKQFSNSHSGEILSKKSNSGLTTQTKYFTLQISDINTKHELMNPYSLPITLYLNKFLK